MVGVVLAALLGVGAGLAFVLRRLPLEFTVLALALAAVLGGWLSPSEALAGFANPATLAVVGMFVISAALVRSGGLAPIERALSRTPWTRAWQQLLLLALVVGPLSAVISNTAVVAMFIPVVERWSKSLGVSPSRLLMPLSFFTVLAGMGTLLGTSSTLVASSLSADLGYGAFGLLQFTPLALGVYGVGVLQLLLLAPVLLPGAAMPATAESLERDYGIQDYLCELRVTPRSPLLGSSLDASLLQHTFDVRVLALVRDGAWLSLPLGDRQLQAGDLLVVKAAPERLLALQNEGLEFADGQLPLVLDPEDEAQGALTLVETMVPDGSRLISQTLREIRFAQRFNAVVLAIRRGEDILRDRLGQVRLQLGDALLLQAPHPSVRGLQGSRDLLLIATAEIPEDRRDRLPWAVGLALGVLLLTAWRSEWLVVWALLAVAGFVASRVLTPQEVYAAIRWDVVVLLAALLPLATLLQRTGVDQWLVAQLVLVSAAWSPYALLVALYLLTALLTELVSNQAAVALMLPVGLALCQGTAVSATAAMGVMSFAASHSFLTPIGYQTNAMVYAVGNYSFRDFFRLGLPLTTSLCLLTPALALWLWP